ncbi:MAG: cytidine deaminase [Oscillospiraceae bacterium]|nr:cytidine deaminase [Oscillospiraceae bacterium]
MQEKLIQQARLAMEKAYAPYSEFQVGAALLGADGNIYTGCNVENAAYSPTLCAERVAVGKAVSSGCREFVALAVCGGKNGEIRNFCTPCGVCRQVLSEFCSGDFPVYLTNGREMKTRTLAQLLPEHFSL